MSAILAKVLLKDLVTQLAEAYDAREAENMSMELLRHFIGLDRMKVALNDSVQLNSDQKSIIQQAVNRLLKNEPLQHITGEVEFYGLLFKTDHRALIPRPETEELVDWIIENHSAPNLRVLDIGTGTGCIPITLAKKLNSPQVSALDISQEALSLAAENAGWNGVKINFTQLDVLSESLPQNYDLIVSNPPYIPLSDQQSMSANVLDYEPGLALFVSNEKPLIFYERIAMLAMSHLAPGGNLYYEIHEAYSQEVIHLLESMGFSEVQLRKDLQGKNRMIKATKA